MIWQLRVGTNIDQRRIKKRGKFIIRLSFFSILLRYSKLKSVNRLCFVEKIMYF